MSKTDYDRWLAGGLPFAPLGEALANMPEEPPSIVPGFVVKGLIATIAGVPKVGKSTFTFGMIRAIARGLPFLGRQTERAGVLLLSEERELTLGEKRDIFGLGDHDLHLLMRYQAPNDWEQTVELATLYCTQHGLDLLVIDPWDKWAGFGLKEENDAGAQLQKLAPLYATAAEGIAILIVQHQAKNGGIRGSNAFAGAVDVVLELERTPDDKAARLLRGASRLRATPEFLRLAWDPWTGLYSEQSASTLPSSPWD